MSTITATATPRTAARYIAPGNLHELGLRIDNANHRLANAGVSEQFSAEVVAELETETETGEITTGYYVRMSAPRIGTPGYTLAASLDVQPGGVIVRTVPGVDLSEWKRPDDHACEHCGISRRRTRSYVVRNDVTGEILQVGSSCLELFLGVRVAGLWALEMDPADALDNGPVNRGTGAGVLPTYRVDHVLRLAYVLSNEGRAFVPRSRADEDNPATADYVLGVLTHRFGHNRRHDDDVRGTLAAAAEIPAETVAEILATAETLGDGDYGQNMRVAVGGEEITHRAVGIVASLVGAYRRNLERETERAAAVNEHIGEVKQRIRDLPVTVRSVRYLDGAYGTTTVLNMRDTDGRVVVWFASRSLDYEIGDELEITGTVKAHDEYKGTRQTVLTRCKVSES